MNKILDTLSLKNIGMSGDEIQMLIKKKDEKEQMLQLRKYRCFLLEEIHEKQKALDKLDYIIYQMKEEVD